MDITFLNVALIPHQNSLCNLSVIPEAGHIVEVVLPKYDCLNYSGITQLEEETGFEWGGSSIRCWRGMVEGVVVNFLEPDNGMFWVNCIYGRKEDGARFHFFCNAALEWLALRNCPPDIVHCHDWSSAPAVWLLAESYAERLAGTRSVFTIHNLEFGQPLIARAMAACSKATTVHQISLALSCSTSPTLCPYLCSCVHAGFPNVCNRNRGTRGDFPSPIKVWGHPERH